MKNTTKNTLLFTVATAALMAGAGLVSAQDMKGNREAPAAATTTSAADSLDAGQSSLPGLSGQLWRKFGARCGAKRLSA